MGSEMCIRDSLITQHADQLRQRITGLVGQVPGQSTHVTQDAQGACDPDEGHWPRTWYYTVSAFLPDGADWRGGTTGVVQRLDQDGWQLRTDTDEPDELDVTAQKDGYVITVRGGGPRDGGPGAIGLDGSTPCVSEDGTIDRREQS